MNRNTRNSWLTVLLTVAVAGPVMAQTAATRLPVSVTTRPAATAPTSMPATPLVAPVVLVPTTGPVITEPFIGRVSSDRVYVRSAAQAEAYALGQLRKNELVKVVGQKNGWYLIAAPTGTVSYVAKELLQPAADGKTGEIKGEYVNVRAASALFPNSSHNVLAVVQKGTAVGILGETDKFYLVTPPEKAYVYVSSQFIKPAEAGATYSAPELYLPANVKSLQERAVAATAPTNNVAGTQPGNTDVTTQPTEVVIVPPVPTVTVDQSVYKQFADLNARTQAELTKPLREEKLEPYLAEFTAMAAQKDAPSSVVTAAQARIEFLNKRIEIQKLAMATAPEQTAALDQQRAALQETFDSVQRKLAAAAIESPTYLASGRLQTSTAVAGKYVLVNPNSGRTVAYLRSDSDIDLTPLLGQFVGIKGRLEQVPGTQMQAIRVSSATLMPVPKDLQD
ncbi:MAG: SH3 domain-containing protein [Phycisphaerae bacterium]